MLEGGWDEARRIAREAPAGNSYLQREVATTRAYLARARGESEAAWAEVRAVLSSGPATPPGGVIHQHGLFMIRLAVDLALDTGDLPAARTWLEAHDRWLDWNGAVLGRADGQLAWARWFRVAGDPANARSAAEQALVLAEAPRQPLALLAAHRTLGELATEAGRGSEAAAELAAALALADDCAAPYERALTLRALSEAAPPIERTALLAEVDAICRRLGAAPALARAADARPRVTPLSERSPDYPAGLTQREVEVLRLVADGLTDAAVGERLFISPRTVSQHLRSIYGKLEVASRASATRFAIEHGLA